LARAAVALFRAIVVADPSEEDDLASALIDLSIRHAAVGHLDEAVSASTEAAAILRRRETDGDRAASELAAALVHLADQQLRLGRPELALDPALEAADGYRALCGTNLHGFRYQLADSLDILGKCQALLGQTDEARETMREAVATYEELAASSPEEFADELAAARERLSKASAP
jgi:tetratricopeptide (TPR) repeat protein